jgi:hypothetical protein
VALGSIEFITSLVHPEFTFYPGRGVFDKAEGPLRLVLPDSAGRNEASTFTGLCSAHDADLFRPIDTRELDVNDREQFFLLAYRSVTREVHAPLLARRFDSIEHDIIVLDNQRPCIAVSSRFSMDEVRRRTTSYAPFSMCCR